MNRSTGTCFTAMLGVLSALVVLLVCSGPVHAAVSFSQAPGAKVVTAQATGVYSVVLVNKDGTNHTTLALFNKGKLLDAHTQRPGGWLKKKSGNSPKPLSTATLQQLIQIAGLNQDVEKLPAAKKTQFYQTAGLSSSPPPSLPLEVPPVGKQCPAGYRLELKPKLTCRPITYRWPGLTERFASLWDRLALVPAAEARLQHVVIHVGDFSLIQAAYMRDDFGQEVYQFSLLGVMIEFFFTPGG
jgi:hypothetical protein